MDDWRSRYGDLGDTDEVTMVRQWYPNGKQDTCALPIFVPISKGCSGIAAVHGGQPNGPTDGQLQLEGPAVVALHCATQGAAILYKDSHDKDASWHYYREPIRLQSGQRTVLITKSTRIGYQPSDETQLIITTR